MDLTLKEYIVLVENEKKPWSTLDRGKKHIP